MADERFSLEGSTEKVVHQYPDGAKLDMRVTRSQGKPSQFVSVLHLGNGDQTTTTVRDDGSVKVQDLRNGQLATTEIKDTKITGPILAEWNKAITQGKPGVLEPKEFDALEKKLDVANAAIDKQQQLEMALAKSGSNPFKPQAGTIQVAFVSDHSGASQRRAEGHSQDGALKR